MIAYTDDGQLDIIEGRKVGVCRLQKPMSKLLPIIIYGLCMRLLNNLFRVCFRIFEIRMRDCHTSDLPLDGLMK